MCRKPNSIDLTPQVWKTIVSVNQRVNSSIKAVTDADHWGVVDIWGFPDDGRATARTSSSSSAAFSSRPACPAAPCA